MTQKNCLLDISRKNKEAIIIGSLGTISYDLSLIPHKRKVITKGAMGCVLGISLGMALTTKRKVIVVIGDGSFIMKMGSMSSILRYKPSNLKVIILNNNSYKSCGGQKTNFKYIKRYLPKSFKVYDVI